MDNGIGTAYGIVAKEILQIFYRGDRYAVARVIDGGYNSTECLVELEAKFLAAMEVLSQKLYEESGISLPMTVRQAILHADADDPLIIRASQMVQKIGLTEDKKAEIAYQMMRAINWQHQEANYYEYLKCSCSYCPPMPLTVETIKNCQFDPYDDTQFTFIEFNSWPMIEGKYLPITQAIMSVIGIAPLHFVVKQKHQEKQAVDACQMSEPCRW